MNTLLKFITKHRWGTSEDWEKSSVILENAEVVIEECTNGQIKLKVGDGIHIFKDLPYVTDEVEQRIRHVDEELARIITDYPITGGVESEVENARTINGHTYDSLGLAVNKLDENIRNIEGSVNDFMGKKAVDGLTYENSMLQLTSNNMPVGDPVKIVAGTGGGGGGSYASTVSISNNNGVNAINSVAGSEVHLLFTFTSTEKINDDYVTTGNYTCNINIIKNNNEREIKRSFSAQQVPQDVRVDQYLTPGVNVVEVQCVDIYGAERTLRYTITVIELYVTSTFNSSQVFIEADMLESDQNSIAFSYTCYGESIVGSDGKIHHKSAHFKLDNKEFRVVNNITTSGVQDTIHIPISYFTEHKVYDLEVTLELDLGDNNILPSEPCNYSIMFAKTGYTNPLLSSVYNVEEVVQGTWVKIPYFLYDPSAPSCDGVNLTITYNDNQHSRDIRNDITRKQHQWETRNYPVGDNIKFSIYYSNQFGQDVEVTHTLSITESDLNIELEKDLIQLYLTANGRSNQSSDREAWYNKTYIKNDDTNEYLEKVDTVSMVTFNDRFNWESNGWIPQAQGGDTCLRLNGGSQATVNFDLFSSSNGLFRDVGKTIEFDFAVRNVSDVNANIISCFSEKGIIADANSLTFNAGNIALSCWYKEEERVRVAITVDPQSNGARFVCLYLNGVLSRVEQYAENVSFVQDSPVGITLGSDSCELDVYNIRVYKKALTAQQVLHNYLYDISDINLKTSLYHENNIYDPKTGKLNYTAVSALVPTITFTGDMPEKKGSKKIVKMDFVNPLYPDGSRDFSKVYGGPIYVQIDVQGTSSQDYIRKNWKIKLGYDKDGNKDKSIAAYQHMPDEIASKVFCIKVDYAEATGTHNTQNANLVETFYNNQILPQKNNDKVRTTITGFPCVIFEKADDNSEPVFSSKGNFNFDKGSEEVFGFTTDYDTECWEFCNNDDSTCKFLANIPKTVDWVNNFEARYWPQSSISPDNGLTEDEIEELEDLIETYKEDASLVSEDDIKLITDQGMKALTRFRAMHNWVVSTNTSKATNSLLATPAHYGRKTYAYDTAEYRLAKFKAEFENYFDLDYSTIYYTYTLFALMTDQRAKNMFLTYWEGKWYPYFYDNDTSFGIGNTGDLKFDYYHEDTDQVGNADVYNGQESTLWVNFSKCFASQIKDTYVKLRDNKKLDYNRMVDQFITQGSDIWSASIYNEDAEYKYVSLSRPDFVPPENYTLGQKQLYQVRGTGEEHFRYFIDNRFDYCDSKWDAPAYANDTITCRVYTPNRTAPDGQTDTVDVVTPDPSISVIPAKNLYVGVRYKRNGLQQKYRYIRENEIIDDKLVPKTFTRVHTPQLIENEIAEADPSTGEATLSRSISTDYDYYIVDNISGASIEIIDAVNGKIKFVGIDSVPETTVTIVEVDENGFEKEISVQRKLINVCYYGYDGSNFNDTETAIYGASNLQYLGDLSPLYCNSLHVGAARKLTKLIVGSQLPGYNNPNLKEISLFGRNEDANGNKLSDPLLEILDISNCSSLSGTLDASYCTNLEEIYCKGTKLSNIALPIGGKLSKIYLPETISNLTIRSQLFLTELNIDSYANIETLWLENTNLSDIGLDHTTILNNCLTAQAEKRILSNVRIDDIDWTFNSIEDAITTLRPLYNCGGLDISGNPTSAVALTGTIYIKGTITGGQYNEIRNHFDAGLKIRFDKLESVVTFCNWDGTEIYYESTLNNPPITGGVPNYSGLTCPDPLEDNLITKPIRPQDNESTYTYIGWNITKNQFNADEYALQNILGDRTVYAAFAKMTRKYTVKFFSGTELLYKTEVGYNQNANYSGSDPLNTTVSDPSKYSFTGWYPSPSNITEDTDCYAQFVFNDTDKVAAVLSEFEYTKDDTNATLSLDKYTPLANDDDVATDAYVYIEPEYNIGDTSYTVTAVGNSAFTNVKNESGVSIEHIELPETLNSVGSLAFANIDTLTNITIPKSVIKIGNSAFMGCESVSNINYYSERNTVSVKYGETPFDGCGRKYGVTLRIGNNIKTLPAGLFYQSQSDKPIINELVWEDETSCTEIGTNCFTHAIKTTFTLPKTIVTLRESALLNNRYITKIVSESQNDNKDTTLVLPNSLKTISDKTFGEYTELETVVIPYTVNNISGAPFQSCSKLTHLEVESGNNNYTSANNCLISLSDSKIIQGSANTETVIPNEVTTIGAKAFHTLPVEYIIIEDGSLLKAINSSAFYACSELKHIDLSKITHIGSLAFYGASSLTEVDLSSLKVMSGSYTFANCDSLTKLIFPNHSFTNGDHAFAGCKALSDITWGEISDIGAGCFDGAFTSGSSITEIVNLPTTLTTIGNEAFARCTALTHIKLPSSIKTLGSNVINVGFVSNLFVGCNNLNLITCDFNSTDVSGAPWGTPGTVEVRFNDVTKVYENGEVKDV